MIRSSRWPMWLGIAYAVLVVAAFALAMQPGGDGMQGVWSAVLALPWSVLTVFLFKAINPRLLDHFGPVVTLAGGILNAWIVYVIARKVQKRDQ